jgi:hypothetical protein
MKLIFSFILFPVIFYAQNLDSLYNVLLNSSKSHVKHELSPAQTEGKKHDKCGFGLHATIKEHFSEFTVEQQQNISNIMARPELQKSIVSPSGIFRIHYDTTGFGTPQYSITELAVAFDSAYNFEVNILGYPPPPKDNKLGGDDKYDIYVLSLSGGLYGATTPETNIPNTTTFESYIEIDNSFNKNEGYNSFGINAARVTAAHEFHHAIQLGNYIFRSEDTYYYELTSTAFEEFVYDEVNDYYAYMNSYFRNTSGRLEDNSGYNLAIWNIFLKERFEDEDPMLGYNIVKRSWEYLVSERAIIAVAKAMRDYDKSFANEFNTFGDWLHFTDMNTKTGEFFEEASNYPQVRSNYTIELNNDPMTMTFQSEPTSINFFKFLDYSQGFTDTIVAVISNSDIYGSTSEGNNAIVEFTFGNNIFPKSNSINDFYYSSIEGDKTEFIQESYIINNLLSYQNINRGEIDFVFPQPFNFAVDQWINIPTYPDLTNRADLNIYSSDMNLVYSGTEAIVTNDYITVKWDGRDNSGNKVASGVYVYVTKANGKIKKGKFVIFN